MDDPDMEYLEEFYHNADDLVYALLVVLVATFICDLARELLLYGGKFNLEPTWRYAVAEIIGTMEAVVICFEINFIIYDVFGVFVYMLAIFIASTWQAKRPPELHYLANPLMVMVKHIDALTQATDKWGTLTSTQEDNVYGRFDSIMIFIVAEAFGAYIAYNFVLHAAWNNAKFWTLWKKNNYHTKRFKTSNEWLSSMTQGPVPAAIAEGVISFAQYLWPMYVGFRGLQGDTAILVENAGHAIFAGMAAQYSGGYFNPIYGTALELTTHGYSTLTKGMVYWVAPFTGTVLGIILDKLS